MGLTIAFPYGNVPELELPVGLSLKLAHDLASLAAKARLIALPKQTVKPLNLVNLAHGKMPSNLKAYIFKGFAFEELFQDWKRRTRPWV